MKKRLRGTIRVPGDKSISHRGIMLGSIAKGTTELTGFLDGADCRSTIRCFQEMGIDIIQEQDHVVIHGMGLHGLRSPVDTLDVGNSGTTTRLISGILAAQDFTSQLNGDASIQTRPMKRIMEPLNQMGANITSIRENGCAPLRIVGKPLHGIHYDSPVASAQVKSAILLAGLYADSETSVTEPSISRDHTERMLRGFGADIRTLGRTASVLPCQELHGQQLFIPGDISSAAYFIAAGLLSNDADIMIEHVNTNPTRAGILEVVRRMGGSVTLENQHDESGEPVADLHVVSSHLHGCEISGDLIPTLIDEIPVIAVMAAAAEGQTIIRDAAELKVKESDRIQSICDNLAAMGCNITPTDDGMIIEGGAPLHGAHIQTHADHRIAMAFTIASLLTDDDVMLDVPHCVTISYPRFYDDLASLYD
ncbi:MAG: 3-phosphoshikimate 1-carboxyvinyltransferase [Lachnospiraceae bacterium]|nr:3-phosphoshikimate 1-carboxyvinyltransferase [Lachnospiraceae bacterium]